MANLDRYINQVRTLLDTLRIEYNSIEATRHDSISMLLRDKENDQNFQFARNEFNKAFGWEMAQFNKTFYACKKTSSGAILIEAKLR